MKLLIYSVYDSKAQAYLQPFYALSRGAAIRMFSDAANDQKHEFFKHAADYTLFELGTLDQRTGVIECNQVQENLGLAINYLDSASAEKL